MSLKDTLHLPKTEMPINANLTAREGLAYEQWDKTNAYKRLRRNGENPFILHDGPPYANGDIHIGHALNKILKDFVVKTQYFNGRSVEFVPGWDCHGLPIEKQVGVMIRLGGGNMPQFNEPEVIRKMCRTYASEQVARQLDQFKKLGVLADWENRYETMSPEFEAMITRRLQELKDKGFLFRRKKPVYWSWAEKTALAEAEIEYKDKTDKAIYLLFEEDANPLMSHSANVGVLVWTTTPWTLPANVAVAVSDKVSYCIAKWNDRLVFTSQSSVEELRNRGVEIEFIRKSNADFAQSLWLKHPIMDRTVPVVLADFVAQDKGTGCVHIAPGHGDEDYQVGVRYNLPLICPVDVDGRYNFGPYSGQFVFDANDKIIEDLKDNVVLTEEITHSYPHCWRSHTPVIYLALDQWFLDLEKIRAMEPVKVLEQVEFVPEHAKGRMLPMLQGRPDWCLSRQRVWGVPIFDSGDILDVWFDSGLTWDTLGGRQADLYLEGNDQHRGWFQSSLWLSLALTGRAPYKKVVTHGFVVDQNGEKMAKSKGNVVSPLKVVEKYGAEVLRFWVASVDYTKDLQCSDEILKRCAEGYKKLRNTLRYFVANFGEKAPPLDDVFLFRPLDAWILNKSKIVFDEVHQLFSEYSYCAGMQKLMEFINGDLSAVYMNAVKDCLYCGEESQRQSVIAAMTLILQSFVGLLAPLFTYTIQEVLSYCPDWFGSKDVFDWTYQPLVLIPGTVDETYWKAALDGFHVAFDKLKADKIVKDPLEVGVEGPKSFEGVEDWFAVSAFGGMTDLFGITDHELLAEFKVGDDLFRIVRMKKNKCQRCWKRIADEELCPRCKNEVVG